MISLPLFTPQLDLHALHFNAPFRPLADDTPSASAADAANAPHPANHQQQRQQQQRRDEERRQHNARSPIALLAADEAAIAHRKAAIAHFGAYWIRPPGVAKTLQAMTEELAELAEQEELLRQEQGLRDMQAQQERDEARERAAETAAQLEEGEGEVERDLDDDVPEAEAEDVEDVTFNEDSMMEGSQHDGLAMEEAELTGAARDEEDLGIEPEHDLEQDLERNLDDSIPDAGSYQHTDTEVEDSTSESELQDSFARPSTGRSARLSSGRRHQARQPTNYHTPDQPSDSTEVSSNVPPPAVQGGLQQRMRAQAAAEVLPRSPASWNLSSSILESSFVGSSPVMQRGPAGRGGARQRGRGS